MNHDERNPLLLTALINGVKLLLGQLDHGAHHVLFEMLYRRGSRDREHGAGALKKPSECDLAGSCLMPPGNLVKQSALASKLSSRQREPGDKADTLTCAAIDHSFGLGSRHIFGRTIRQVITVLNGDNGHDLLCSCELIAGDI